MMKIAIMFSALVSFLIIMPLVYMFADNEPPYVFDVERSYITPVRVQSLEPVIVHWYLLKINRICPGIIIRYIVDSKTGIKTTYDATNAVVPDNKDDRELERVFFLPQGITPGPKIYRSDGLYVCNMVHRFWPLHVLSPDLHFDVYN